MQPQLINTGVTPSKSKTNRSKIDLLLINLLAAVLVVDPVTARSENIQKFVCLQAQLPARYLKNSWQGRSCILRRETLMIFL